MIRLLLITIYNNYFFLCYFFLRERGKVYIERETIIYMNIIMTKRIQRINEIVTTIVKLKEAELEIDEKNMADEVCIRHGCSDKTAREYIRIARLKVERLPPIE